VTLHLVGWATEIRLLKEEHKSLQGIFLHLAFFLWESEEEVKVRARPWREELASLPTLECVICDIHDGTQQRFSVCAAAADASRGPRKCRVCQQQRSSERAGQGV
jgi:hypothetical protein